MADDLWDLDMEPSIIEDYIASIFTDPSPHDKLEIERLRTDKQQFSLQDIYREAKLEIDFPEHYMTIT